MEHGGAAAVKMTDGLKFFVVMPVYNAAGWLKDTLYHLSRLEEGAFEVCFVDDGSSDGSGAILKEYCSSHRNALCICTEHGGVSAARNIGIAAARGDYVLFLDSDDRFSPNIFAVLGDCLAESRADIAVFGARVINYDSRHTLPDIQPRDIFYRGFSPHALFKEQGARPYVWNCAYGTQFLHANGLMFDEGVSLGEDQLFQFAAFPKASAIRFISDKLYCYNYLKFRSAMGCFLADGEERLRRHLLLVQKALRVWAGYGIAEENKPLFADWIYHFLYDDFTNIKGRRAREYSRYLKNILSEYDISAADMRAGIAKKLRFCSLTRPFVNRLLNMLP